MVQDPVAVLFLNNRLYMIIKTFIQHTGSFRSIITFVQDWPLTVSKRLKVDVRKMKRIIFSFSFGMKNFVFSFVWQDSSCRLFKKVCTVFTSDGLEPVINAGVS